MIPVNRDIMLAGCFPALAQAELIVLSRKEPFDLIILLRPVKADEAVQVLERAYKITVSYILYTIPIRVVAILF